MKRHKKNSNNKKNLAACGKRPLASTGLNMRNKFIEIKEKYFIEDRVIKRRGVPSAELGWRLHCGAVRGGGVAVGCAVIPPGHRHQLSRGGGPATTYWTTVTISAVYRAGLSKKSSHFP